jgi:hypothetical protein
MAPEARYEYQVMKLLPNKLQRTLSLSCGLHSFDFGFVPLKFLRYHGIGGLSEYQPNSKAEQSLLSFRMLLCIISNVKHQNLAYTFVLISQIGYQIFIVFNLKILNFKIL